MGDGKQSDAKQRVRRDHRLAPHLRSVSELLSTPRTYKVVLECTRVHLSPHEASQHDGAKEPAPYLGTYLSRPWAHSSKVASISVNPRKDTGLKSLGEGGKAW
jgi:hypothetical protein